MTEKKSALSPAPPSQDVDDLIVLDQSGLQISQR